MAKASKSLGNLLRDLRQQQGLSRKRLSFLSKASESLIGLIELGERSITRETAEKIAPHLGVAASYLYEVDAESANVSEFSPDHIVYSIFDIALLRSDTILTPMNTTSIDLSNTCSNLNSLDEIQSAICALCVDAARLPSKDRYMRCYVEGLQSRDRERDNVIDRSAVLMRGFDTLLASGGRIELIFRLGHSPEYDRRIFLWISKMTVRYSMHGLSDRFIVSFLKGRNVHRFPRDVWLTKNAFVDAFPIAREHSIEKGIIATGQFPAMEAYLDLIGRHVSQSKIEAFFPDTTLEVSRRINQDVFAYTKLVQSFFTTATRPVGDFSMATPQSLSSWMKRLASAHGVDPNNRWSGPPDAVEKIQKIAREHELRASKFADHCESSEFIQVCDQQTIEEWAKTGHRTDVVNSVHNDSPHERRERIDKVISYLRRFRNFNLIAHPDISSSYLTAVIEEESRRVVSWMIEGSARLVVGGSVRRISDTNQRWKLAEAAGEDQLAIFFSNQDIVDVFNNLFDTYVNPLDLDTHKQKAIDFLISARSHIKD